MRVGRPEKVRSVIEDMTLEACANLCFCCCCAVNGQHSEYLQAEMLAQITRQGKFRADGLNTFWRCMCCTLQNYKSRFVVLRMARTYGDSRFVDPCCDNGQAELKRLKQQQPEDVGGRSNVNWQCQQLQLLYRNMHVIFHFIS